MKEGNFHLWQDLKNCEAYRLSMDLGEIVWHIVDEWQWHVKKTIGMQYTESADSVAANIAEGWGRYSYKDKYNFFRIARGSLLETMTWTAKAHKRGLVPAEQMIKLQEIFIALPFEINKLMKQNKGKK